MNWRRLNLLRAIGVVGCLAFTPCCVRGQQLCAEQALPDEVESVHNHTNGMAGRPPRPGEPINDRELLRFLETEGRKLVDSGATLTNWNGRLKATSCKLKLPSTSARVLSPAEAAQRIEPAVAVLGTFYVCAKCSKVHVATATGFFLTRSGALATCRHVLEHYKDNGRGMVVLTRDGRLCGVREVLGTHATWDLAVLQVDGEGFTPLPVSPRTPPTGAPVYLVSHPEHHFYFLSTGIVARPGGNGGWLNVTADFAKGSSGAPVCDATGAVVGIANNTESIYYSSDNDQQNNLQMVLKNCTPARALLLFVNKN